MNIAATRFGNIEVDESKIIEMRGGGILGFENLERYTLNVPEENSPFWWLQSLDDNRVAFFVINPFVAKADYEPIISDNDADILEIEGEKDVVLLAIITISRDPVSVYVNLRAPIVINAKKMTGKQIILEDSSYPVQYQIIKSSDCDDIQPGDY